MHKDKRTIISITLLHFAFSQCWMNQQLKFTNQPKWRPFYWLNRISFSETTLNIAYQNVPQSNILQIEINLCFTKFIQNGFVLTKVMKDSLNIE